MNKPLMGPSIALTIIGWLSVAVAIHGVISGRVIAGSKGFKTNYYYRADQPGLYYFFVVLWFALGGVFLVLL